MKVMLVKSAVAAAVIASSTPANAQQRMVHRDTAGFGDAMALGAEAVALRTGRGNQENQTEQIGRQSGVQGRSGRRNTEISNGDTSGRPDLDGGRTGRRANVDRARTGRSAFEYWLATIGAAIIVVLGAGVTVMRRRKR